MSDIESYTGTLIPVDLDGKTVDEWIKSKLETDELVEYCSSWMEMLDEFFWKEYFLDNRTGILYKIDKTNFNAENFSQLTSNPNGTFDFTVSFYNGGTHLIEMLDELMKNTNTTDNVTDSVSEADIDAMMEAAHWDSYPVSVQKMLRQKCQKMAEAFLNSREK